MGRHQFCTDIDQGIGADPKLYQLALRFNIRLREMAPETEISPDLPESERRRLEEDAAQQEAEQEAEAAETSGEEEADAGIVDPDEVDTDTEAEADAGIVDPDEVDTDTADEEPADDAAADDAAADEPAGEDVEN